MSELNKQPLTSIGFDFSMFIFFGALGYLFLISPPSGTMFGLLFLLVGLIWFIAWAYKFFRPMDKKTKKSLIIFFTIAVDLIAGVMLLLALGPWQTSFYIILRILVSIASIILVCQSFKYKQTVFAWAFVAVAILFNPIYPIYLQKDVWKIIDIFGAVLFFAISYQTIALKSSNSKIGSNSGK